MDPLVGLLPLPVGPAVALVLLDASDVGVLAPLNPPAGGLSGGALLVMRDLSTTGRTTAPEGAGAGVDLLGPLELVNLVPGLLLMLAVPAVTPVLLDASDVGVLASLNPPAGGLSDVLVVFWDLCTAGPTPLWTAPVNAEGGVD